MRVTKFIIILLLLMGTKAYAQSISLTVISNQDGAPPEMKLNELKSIFLGQHLRWKNGDTIVIALMKTSSEIGKNISKKIYDMKGDELNKFWLALVFQGKTEPPNFFDSVGMLQKFVSKNPGAIGIIDDSPPLSGVRVVLIDGQKSF